MLPLRTPFNPDTQHVPCLAHVMNLAVQAMLGIKGLRATAPKRDILHEEDEEDYSDGNVTVIADPSMYEEDTEHAEQAEEVDAPIENEALSQTLAHSGLTLDGDDDDVDAADEQNDTYDASCSLAKLQKGIDKIR